MCPTQHWFHSPASLPSRKKQTKTETRENGANTFSVRKGYKNRSAPTTWKKFRRTRACKSKALWLARKISLAIYSLKRLRRGRAATNFAQKEQELKGSTPSRPRLWVRQRAVSLQLPSRCVWRQWSSTEPKHSTKQTLHKRKGGRQPAQHLKRF